MLWNIYALKYLHKADCYVPCWDAPSITTDGEIVSVLVLSRLEGGLKLVELLLSFELEAFDRLLEYEYKLDAELLRDDKDDLALEGSGIWAWNK